MRRREEETRRRRAVKGRKGIREKGEKGRNKKENG